MQFLLVLIALLCLALVWYFNARAVGGSSPGRSEVTENIQRLMTRGGDAHPAEDVDDARLAAAGLVVAVATMDGPLSQKEIVALTRQAQQVFDVTEREALDILSYGRWVAAECETQEEAVERLVHRIEELAGLEAGPDMVKMIEAVATADGNAMGKDAQQALATVRRVLSVA